MNDLIVNIEEALMDFRREINLLRKGEEVLSTITPKHQSYQELLLIVEEKKQDVILIGRDCQEFFKTIPELNAAFKAILIENHISFVEIKQEDVPKTKKKKKSKKQK